MDSDQKERGEFGRQESEGKYAAESMDKKNSASDIEGGVQVSSFDYSVENFFAAMDAVSAICGETGEQRFEAGEIERFSSMITFLKEWRYFCYDPKIINFTFDTESAQAKEVTEGIILSQFSSAAVPKMDPLPGRTRHLDSNDFVLHAGGHVWGLDWCPRIVEKPDSKTKCEYLAVAAHPPGSVYHKIGVPLIGRGIIQIWCLLSLDEKVECVPTRPRRGKPKKERVKEETLVEMSIIKRPRGRPRKRPVEGDAIYASSAEVESDLPRPRGSPRKQGLLIAVDLNASQKLSPLKHRGRPRKRPALDCNDANESLPAKRRGRPRKIPPPSIDDSIDKHISPPCSNSRTLSTSGSVLPITVDCGTVSLTSNLSADINCKEETIQKMPGERPGKNPFVKKEKLGKNSVSSVTEFVPVSHVESGNNTSSLAISSRQESLNINESCLCSNNQIRSTSEQILPSTVESGNSASVLPVSADVNCNKETTQPNCRGRPRKNPIPSVNKCRTASGVESVTLPTVSSLGTSNVDESPKCCDSQTLSVSQDILPDLGSVALVSPVSTDVNCKEAAAQMRHRGRPRKHSVSSANECDPASCVESGNNTFPVATSGRPETLNINESCSCDNQIPSASECILSFTVEPGNSASALHVSGVIDCNAETIQRRCRGRPRKKPFHVNKCVMASGSKSENDISPLPTSSRLGTLSVDESPLCSDNQTLIVSDGFLPDLGNAALSLPVAADVDCKEETVQRRRRGRPRKSSVSSLNECDPTPCVEPGHNTSSLATSSGPGTFCNNQILSTSECILPLTVKPGRPETLNINESCSCDNQIPSASECILSLTVEPGNSASALHVSGVIDCNAETIQRRRRGRPRKKPFHVNKCVMASGSKSGNDISPLPTSSRLGTLSVDESPLCRDNQTPIVNDGFQPDLGNAALSLPVAADVDCKEETVQRRRRGRPRKNLVSSLNECDPTPCVEPGNNTSSLATSSRPGTFCNNQILSTSECILPSTVKPGNSADRNCNVETIRLRHRRRPQKKPDLTANECSTSSGMESGNDISTLPTFSRFGTLNVDESSICSDKLTVNQGFQHDLGNVALASSVPTDANCMVDAIQRRLRRRPEKQLDISINESGVESGNDTLALPNSRGPGTTNVVESPLCSNPRDVMFLNDDVAHESSSKVDFSGLIPKDIALPRVVLCLAHNGKVAWDVKWRPSAIDDSGGKHHMGFLAVLLGNGSLEVWEVPSPSMVKVLYASSCGEGTDPRFLKLEPVFRCSKVKCGDRQSIPLTLEWSPSAHHDLILAGCHDGTVALWKFAKQYPSQDTKPLLCFSADSAPIRALAWSPNESYEDSAHLFMTAGHEGLKFWDLRDPYRPLWDFNPAQRAILSVDWVKDLRCIILSLEDGTVRILSLWKAACDVPVTGRPFVGKKCQGLHNFFCSSFAIWSAQLSRTTGLVAYCGADGSTVCFQLTKAVDKDPKRNPKPHFLCGKLMERGQVLEINTPLPDVPLPNVPFMMKKPIDECGDTTQTIPGYLLDKDQAKQSNHAVSGDDHSISLGNGDSQASSLRNTTSKSRNSERKKQNAGAVAGQKKKKSETEQGTLQGNGKREEGSTQQFEAFPPKVVAMNRVRWNMNKGSERWLCYGGAAGIVRCQQVSLPAMR